MYDSLQAAIGIAALLGDGCTRRGEEASTRWLHIEPPTTTPGLTVADDGGHGGVALDAAAGFAAMSSRRVREREAFDAALQPPLASPGP